MTLDDVEEVRDAVVNTTTGPGNVQTLRTGKRITAQSSFTLGVGLANAERVATHTETTIIGGVTVAGAGVGLVGLAYALSRPES